MIKKLLPYAKIPKSITKKIHELSQLCGIEYLINPVIAVSDISHSQRVKGSAKLRKTAPIFVFTVDCPTLFSEHVMLTLHQYMIASFHFEYLRLNAIVYDIYKFDLPMDVVTFLSQ